MIRKFDDNAAFVNEDSNNVTFCSDEMDILSVGLNNINIYDAKTSIHHITIA